MKKLAFAAAILAFAAIVILFKIQSALQKGEDMAVMRIGLVAPLTGNNAEIAGNVKNIISLYLAESAQNYKIRFELVVEDDQMKPANTAAAVNKLVNVDKVSGLITTLAYAGMVAKPLAARAGVPHINLGSNPEAADGRFSFVNITPPAELVKMLFALFDQHGIQEFALVYMNDSGPMTYVNEIRKSAQDRQYRYKEYPFLPAEKDFKGIIENIGKSGAQTVVVLALPPSLDILGRQIVQNGLGLPLASVGFFNMSNRKELFEGQTFVDAPDGSPEFAEKVRAKLGTRNMFLVAFAQDTIKIYMDSAEDFYKEEGRYPTRAELAENIRNLKDFHGEVGTYDMGPDGLTQSKGVYKTIEGGQPRQLSLRAL